MLGNVCRKRISGVGGLVWAGFFFQQKIIENFTACDDDDDVFVELPK